MQKIQVPITNFQFGEVSPSLTSRTDTPVYGASAQKVENFFLRSEGGVIKRAGLNFIYKFADITYNSAKIQQSRLLPFIFSDDEQYIVSMENAKVRVFKIDPSSGAVALTSTLSADVDSAALPFSDSFMHEYTFAQAGDVMFICHPTFMPRQLVRTSLTAFQIETFIFDGRSDAKQIYQPFYNFHGLGITLDPNGTTGSGKTLTTSAAYWDTTGSQANGNYANSLHVGLTVRYRGKEIQITSVQSATQATGTILEELFVQLDVDAFRTVDGAATIEVTQVNHGMKVNDSVVISRASAVGNIASSNLNGTRTVNSIVDDNKYTFDAGGNSNATVDGGGAPRVVTHAPTSQWDEQSYSALRGFPSAVTFHENRLVFAGTIAQPDSIWMSKSASYYNFDVGTAADADSIHITAAVGEINQIRHLVSNRDLQVFTASSEMFVPSFDTSPVTPTNAQIRRQTPFGVDFIRPQSMDGATVFVQAGGAIVREYLFSDSESAYTAVPVSSLSSHLINVPIEMNTFYGALDRSESYIFVLNADGKMGVFNSNRAEKRAGWVEFTSQGKFHSTVTIDDRVFANVAFPMGDDSTRIVLCEFKSGFNTDMSSTYAATSTNSGIFTVSSQFANGAVVNVISGNNYIGEFTVSGGNVDVSSVELLNSAEIGYKFDVTLTTNPIDANLSGGPVSGQIRSIASVITDLNSTLSASVNGTNLIIRQVTDDMSNQQSPFTGRKEFRLMGYGRTPQVTISQSAPLSLQVNGMIVELVV